MNTPQDLQDRRMDENLRRIGRSVPLPAEPTPLQRKRWKVGAAPPSPATAHTAPVRAWLAAFATTIAASIAVYVMLTAFSGATTVEAGTILHSLRQRLLDGYQVTLENVGGEGLRIDGRFVVGAAPPQHEALAAPVGPYDALFLEARLRANGRHTPPLVDLETAAALHSESQWLYLRLHGVSETLLERYPLAVPLAYLAQQGILVELDGVGETLGALLAALRPAWFAWPGPRPAAPAASDSAGSGDLELLLGDFLLGRADADQVDLLVRMMAQEAGSVTVSSPLRGRHVLVASGFAAPGEARQPPGDRQPPDGRLDQLVLEIHYVENVGIEWAEIRNMGALRGRVRLAPGDPHELPGLLRRDRLLRDGRTTVLRLSQLAELLRRAMPEPWSLGGAGA